MVHYRSYRAKSQNRTSILKSTLIPHAHAEGRESFGSFLPAVQVQNQSLALSSPLFEKRKSIEAFGRRGGGGGGGGGVESATVPPSERKKERKKERRKVVSLLHS